MRQGNPLYNKRENRLTIPKVLWDDFVKRCTLVGLDPKMVVIQLISSFGLKGETTFSLPELQQPDGLDEWMSDDLFTE